MKAKPCRLTIFTVGFSLASLMVIDPCIAVDSLAAPMAQTATNAYAKPIPYEMASAEATNVCRIPSVDIQAPLLPSFSKVPTISEFFRVQIFEQPLMPIGEPTAAENQALARALLAYAHNAGTNAEAPLQDFLAQNPSSAWKPALLLNLGIVWRGQARFTDAIDAWTQAWQGSKDAKDRRGKDLANRALGQLLQLYTWVGANDKIEPLLSELKDRPVMGGMTEIVRGARRSTWMSQHKPENGSKCGPYALQQLLSLTQTNADVSKLFEARMTRHGFSLADLKQLAIESGMAYQMAKRSTNGDIPLNSVMHMKLGHYGALVKKDGDKYLVRDSAFNRIYGQELWIKKTEIDTESDGYFLIPAGTLPEGWRSVDTAEGQKIWGSGPTEGPVTSAFSTYDKHICPPPDDTIQPSANPQSSTDDADGNDNYDNYAMAGASAHLMLASLNIVDTPLFYRSPIGPKVKFKITYNQKDIYSQAVANISNLGPKWTFDWASYLTDKARAGFGVGSDVTVYLSGGSRTTYAPGSGFLQWVPDNNGCTLTYTGNKSGPPVYTVTFPDGSKKIYGDSAGPVSFVVTLNPRPRRIMLRQIVDPAGNTLTMNYDSFGRLAYVNDVTGKTTRLFYDLPTDPFLITRVQDPFGRTASFTYDEFGRLHTSTDMLGLTSAFDYDSSDFIQNLTTPYGVSTFSYTDDAGVSDWDRSLLLTDPAGNREYLIYSESWSPPHSEPAPTSTATSMARGGNGFLNYRNTYYFNKKAMSLYGPNVLPPSSDWGNATIYHWLHDPSSGPVLTSGILESIKPPLESRIWFSYPGQTGAAVSTGISNRNPSVITRLVQSGAEQTSQYSYNGQGRITLFVDPVGRQTTNQYFPNGIDLQYAYQVNGANFDLLAQYAGYNSQHRPSQFIDSSRQIYNLSWNTFGQLAQVVNPKGETFQATYDANGYLQKLSKFGSGLSADYTFGYDSYGRVHTATSLANFTATSEAHTLTYDYDNLDRVTRITYPDSSTEKFIYELLDLAIVYDRSGNRTVYKYDASRHLVSVKDRLNRITYFTWCGCGSLESMTDSLGHSTFWTYDLEARVTYRARDDGKYSVFNYDPTSGWLASVTDSKGQGRSYSYNSDGTLASVLYSDPSTPSVYLTYDPAYLRLTSMSDANGGINYQYNPIPGAPGLPLLGAGQLLSESNLYFGHYSIKYGYDELGRCTNQSIDGLSEIVNFDSLGRISRGVNLLGVFTPVYSFPSGASFRPGRVNLPNGQSTMFTFDNAAGDERLLELKNLYPSGAVLSKFDYLYDVLAQINQWTQQADTSAPTIKALEYDYEGQLLNEKISGNTNLAYTYAYDGAGNRTNEEIDVIGNSPVSTVTKASYNNVNELGEHNGSDPLPVRFTGTINEPGSVTVAGRSAVITVNPASPNGRIFKEPAMLSAGNQTVTVSATDLSGNTSSHSYSLTVAGGIENGYGYDDNGNTVVSGLVTYEWDAADRLVAINTTTNRTEFTYDGFSRCIQIVEKTGGTVTSTKRFAWVRARLAQERDVYNSVAKYFFAGGERFGGTNYFYACDHLGNVRELLDANGTLRARYDYDPYGRRTKLNGDLDADFGFNGYYVHRPSGLYLTLFRAYDPDAGRWLTQDPLGELGGINLYGFVGNNPVNKIDPYGLQFAAAFNNWNPFYQPPPNPSPFNSTYSLGIQGTVNAELGQVAGAGITFTGGVGLFHNPQDGFSVGSFLSAGGFVGGANLNAKFPSDPCQSPGVLFASAGITGGAWVSNAGLPGELDGGFSQYNLNSPISASYAESGGTYIYTLGASEYSWGASVSAYPTTTFNTAGIFLNNGKLTPP